MLNMTIIVPNHMVPVKGMKNSLTSMSICFYLYAGGIHIPVKGMKSLLHPCKFACITILVGSSMHIDLFIHKSSVFLAIGTHQ